jgi:hypothetical protein
MGAGYALPYVKGGAQKNDHAARRRAAANSIRWPA